MSKPPTLRDVASAAGLAPATVSRFLNGGITLPDTTAARIFNAVKSLGYQPNPHARRLSRGRADMVGLAVPDIQTPFFAKLASAADQQADPQEKSVLLRTTLNRPERELGTIEQLRRGYFDGLIFATNRPETNDLAFAINRGPLNVVIVDEDIPGAIAPRVFCDNRQGGRLAARHFLEAGHRTFAYIGGHRNLMSARERCEGFRDTLREAGPDYSLVSSEFGEYDSEHGRAAMTRILAQTPAATAVFAGSDEILLGALGAVRERGLRIGEDIAFVAFDDMLPLSLFDPPITAIRQPVADIGTSAFDLINITGPASPPSEIRLPVELIVRHSVKPPRQAQGRRRARHVP